ncbi:hypothetical protein [Acidovorax sp. CF316]|nr:hypothetical protein [Acidovorax sp. CF316]
MRFLDSIGGALHIQHEGFEVDGLEVKAHLDFGCGWAALVG